jgi:hypothetical protein
MYSPDRIFRHTNFESGICAWYFEAREGMFGPFDSEEQARSKLRTFIKHKIETKDSGRRDENLKSDLRKIRTRSSAVIKLK